MEKFYRKPLRRHDPISDILLWRAVLAQCLKDVLSHSTDLEKCKAEQWTRTKDFATVCDYANYDPDYLRLRIKASRGADLRVRLPYGEGWRRKGRQDCPRRKEDK